MIRVSSSVPILDKMPSKTLVTVSFCCGRIRSVLFSVLAPRQLAVACFCLGLIAIYTILVSYSPPRTYQFVKGRSGVDIKTIFNTSYFHKYSNTDDVPKIEVGEVNCQKLFDNDDEEVDVAGKYHEAFQTNQRSLGPNRLKTLAANCDVFQKKRGYMLKPANPDEEEFPIAFSILMYEQPGQVERLLRAIYRPQNVYCIHVDKKSPPDVHAAMRAVSTCFDNVFIASRKINVTWGHISTVQAETTCMHDLMQYPRWKYFINLTGQEFPLRTMAEIVKILKQYNGANDIPGVPAEQMEDAYMDRIKRPRVGNLPIEKRPEKKPFKHPIHIHFGTAHITASRDFVGFLLNKTVSRDFLAWLEDTRIPDETYFATLAHDESLDMPGAYIGDDVRGNETLNRFKIWRPMQPCSKYRHRVCILGVVNLPAMVHSKSLFANKFHHDVQPLAFDCMEERIYASTKLDIRGWKEFDSGFYKNQPFAVNAKRPETAAAAAAAVAAAAAAPHKQAAKAKDAKGKTPKTGMGKHPPKDTGKKGQQQQQQQETKQSAPKKEAQKTKRDTEEKNAKPAQDKPEGPNLRQSPAVAKQSKKQGKNKTKKTKAKDVL